MKMKIKKINTKPLKVLLMEIRKINLKINMKQNERVKAIKKKRTAQTVSNGNKVPERTKIEEGTK